MVAPAEVTHESFFKLSKQDAKPYSPQASEPLNPKPPCCWVVSCPSGSLRLEREGADVSKWRRVELDIRELPNILGLGRGSWDVLAVTSVDIEVPKP